MLSTPVDSAFRVRSVALGGSPLSLALQQQDDRTRQWISSRPADPESWRDRIAQVRQDFAAADWLTPLAPAFAATGAAAVRLARAAAAGVVVTTGQQPGLFGGPMYTLSKAISALAFSDALEAASGVPVVPVFWAATDDADWLEAAVAHIVGREGLEELRLEGPPTDGVAMADVRLGETSALLERLLVACGSAAHASVVELARTAYVPHATIGSAYVQLMRGVLEPLGIAVLDAAHPAVRRAADPLLRRALSEAAGVAVALSARQVEIEAAGFRPQVETLPSLSLVFRTTIQPDGLAVRERVPVANAMRVAREAETGTLGSNVLLRPVLERALLPTVAYHAGPGELAYFAQVAPVAHALRVAAPVAVPRWAGEPIDESSLRALERLGLTEEMLLSPHEAEHHIARAALDSDTGDSLERLRLAMETQVRALGEAVARADDLVARETIAGLQRDLERRIARMERRLLAATRRREHGAVRDLAVARAALRPLGRSPERVLGFVPWLARHGAAFVGQMRVEAARHAHTLLQGADGAS